MAAALSLAVQHVGLGTCPGCPARAHPVANNPFRMFPSNVMATIRAMKMGPTPSATAIHDAGLSFQRTEDGELEVQGRAYFIVAATYRGPRVRLSDMRVGTYNTNLLIFTPEHIMRLDPELGVVRTELWIRLRARHSFEEALDYMQTLANDHPWFYVF